MTRASVALAAFVLLGAGRVFPVGCARILAIETVGAKSHWNFMSAVLAGLTENGHSVTVFTPFPDGDRANYTEIDVSGVFPIKLAMGLTEIKTMLNSYRRVLGFAFAMERYVCDRLHEDPRMVGMLRRGLREQFDAVFIEPGVMDCLSYMAADANLPLIFTVPLTSFFIKELRAVGHSSNLAVVSSVFADHAVPRTFAQRFSNVRSILYGNVLLSFWETFNRMFDPKPYDSRASVPPSLVFINNHFISEVSSPIPSNVISVGGIHLKPVKKLPKDILEFIEDSPHGVILFTFGSTIAMSSIPEDIQKVLFDILAQLPQRVLLKYEGVLKNKPKNVMTKKWLPQRVILKHPNVKLFFSHGGISGVYEAVEAAVPVLGFPMFSDQYRNIDHLVESGMAISMDIMSITKSTFLANILELLNNNKYIENAKRVATIFKDRPMSPQKSVVYWTEYVIRYNGASHLKSSGLNLTWYQYFLLDVIFVILLSICLSVLIIYKISLAFKKTITKFTQISTKIKPE